jgi:hypothetical protein
MGQKHDKITPSQLGEHAAPVLRGSFPGALVTRGGRQRWENPFRCSTFEELPPHWPTRCYPLPLDHGDGPEPPIDRNSAMHCAKRFLQCRLRVLAKTPHGCCP